MIVELQKRCNLEKFIKCAEASWQHDKGVAQIDQRLLAYRHVADDFKPCETFQTNFALYQGLRDDARDLRTGLQGSPGNLAHQANVTAAINKMPGLLTYPMPKGCGIIDMCLMLTMAGTTKNS